MKFDEFYEELRLTLLNITNLKQLSKEMVLVYVNEAVRNLHSLFNIRVEQAIIYVPSFRNTFVLDEKDPSVIMGALRKIALIELKGSKIRDKKEQVIKLIENDRLLKEHWDKEAERDEKESLFVNNYNEVLQLLEVSDERNTIYRINELNVFSIDQKTLYFPNCKESDTIYVSYKPVPKDSSVEIDLPHSLRECLKSYIMMKITGSVEGYKEFYLNFLNSYTSNLQEAVLKGAILQDSLQDSLGAKKGF